MWLLEQREGKGLGFPDAFTLCTFSTSFAPLYPYSISTLKALYFWGSDVLNHTPHHRALTAGFFPWLWWVSGSRRAVWSEHKGQKWVAGVGRGQPPCLLLGADIAVISALSRPPPPPRLALPSCVKTPACSACWPCTSGPGPFWAWDGQQSGCGRAGCGESVVGQWAPTAPLARERLWFPAWQSRRPAARVALSFWGGHLRDFGHVGPGCCCEL